VADYIPVTAEEWPTTDELWRMLHTALDAGIFTARKQLLFCAAVRRAAGRMPAEYRPVIDELEVFAERSDLPALKNAERMDRHTFRWRMGHDRETSIAKRHAQMEDGVHAVMNPRIEEITRPNPPYYEGYPGLEQDEAVFYAVMGHVFAACERDNNGSITVSPTQSHMLRDILGNPLRPFEFVQRWRTDTVVALARQMYDSRDFGAMPILADALQDAGCENEDVLNHCRKPKTHIRGCWICDLVLGKA
jgi:hypothetical protein